MTPADFGARRTRATLQRLTTTPDALGQPRPSWATAATVWCLKRAMTGKEQTWALQTRAVVTFVLETWHPRSLVAVDPTMRVLVDGREYGVEWADDVDGKHETLKIYCKEQVAPAS